MPSVVKTFLDTNIWVYQFDKSAPTKRTRAQRLIAQQLQTESAVISTQVIQEFINVALGKFITVLSAQELRLLLAQILHPICQHTPSPAFYDRTLDLYQLNSLNFYDALIIQAALDLNCTVLYSEDLQHEQEFGKLKIINPFRS
jgi:predicted nucleic acid-binding protein